TRRRGRAWRRTASPGRAARRRRRAPRSAKLLVPALGPLRALLDDLVPVEGDELVHVGGAADQLLRDLGRKLHRLVGRAEEQLARERRLHLRRDVHVDQLPREVLVLAAAR